MNIMSKKSTMCVKQLEVKTLMFVLIGLSPTQEARSRFGFDSIADSFCEPYSSALADMESYELSNIAKEARGNCTLSDVKLDC